MGRCSPGLVGDPIFKAIAIPGLQQSAGIILGHVVGSLARVVAAAAEGAPVIDGVAEEMPAAA